MGIDKAFMLFRGRLLYKYPLDILHQYCENIIISTANTKFKDAGYTIVEDKYDAIGPIGGIYSCLSFSSSENFLVLGCDMPFITQEFIELLLYKSTGFDITVGMNGKNKPEPLAGIYKASIMPVIERQIQNRNYKMRYLIEKVNSNVVNLNETPLDPGKIFFNLNSPVDIRNQSKNAQG